MCGEHRLEINILVDALKEQVPADLLALRLSPWEIVLAQLTMRLVRNRALNEDAARWAVESWALALEVITPAQSVTSPSQSFSGHLQVGGKRVFTSTWTLDVLGRTRPTAGWRTLGTTPGSIEVPTGYELGVRLHKGSDSEVGLLVQELSAYGPIHALDLSLSGVTDTGLAHLFALSDVVNLSLRGCARITDLGLAHVKRLSTLAELNLCGCDQVTDAGLAHLAALPGLTSLVLKDCWQITDQGLAYLTVLDRLTSLNIRGCSHITNAGLRHLGSLTYLARVSLPRVRGIGAGLVHLTRLPCLTRIDL